MKNLFNFLVIILVACPLLSSAMDSTPSFTKVSEDRSLFSSGHPELVEGRRTGQEKTASDFEIYQLLSFAPKNNPEFYLPTDVVNAIALTAYEITEEENLAIANEIAKTHTLKKQVAEQNQTMQNLANEMRALMQERKDLNEENNYLETLLKAQGKFVDERHLPGHSCLTQ